MDILLIYPPYERLMGLEHDTFPVSLGYIGTILKQGGFSVAIYNAEKGDISGGYTYSPYGRAKAFTNYKKNLYSDDCDVWNDIRSVIREQAPQIVGITSYTPTHSAVLRIARIAKAVCNSIVVIGGPYPTLLPEEACESEEVDYVVSGEGEYAMLELSRYLLKGKCEIEKVKGIAFKKDGKVFCTPKRSRIRDLDALPLIDHDLLLNKKAHKASSLAMIIASRGCPHRCTFCASVPIWDRKVIYRSCDSLLNEIERNHNILKNSSFRFFDDTFTSNVRRTIEFAEKCVERGINKKLQWTCLSRVDSVSVELIKSLEKANCTSICLGVESGSERILKTLKKDINKDMVRDKVKMVKKSKLSLHLYFMMGSPFEKETDILETYEFIEELSPDSMNLTTFTPYYGTELYDICVSKGLVPRKHDTSMYERVGHHNWHNYFCPEIPKERYFELVEMMMELADKTRNRMTRKKLMSLIRGGNRYYKHPFKGVRRAIQKIM